MDKKIAAHLLVRMKKSVSHWRFLLGHKIEKEALMAAYSQVEFYEAILKQVELKDYSCRQTLESFKHIAKTLLDLEIKDTFLQEAYDYSLRYSFPDAVSSKERLHSDLVYDLFLKTLGVINNHQKTSDDGSFMAVYPFEFLTEKEITELEDPREYKAFKAAFEDQWVYTMMKLNYEVEGHSTIEHILGVHYLALHIGRQLKAKGLPIDLGRVSGAAAGHDIGKFGCRAEDKQKIAYYHYYYTYHWFSSLDIDYIKQVAVYHSTWDLEIESLSIESLVLIFSDFCVKRSRQTQGKFAMKFLNVATSFEVILSKLDGMNADKQRRYEKVYLKLKNFYDYMVDLGISAQVNNYNGQDDFEPVCWPDKPGQDPYSGQASVDNLKYKAIESSLKMMHLLRDERALTAMLQDASGQHDSHAFRGYLYIIEEYSTYLTPHQKLMTLDFLSKYVMHPEEDIRKSVGLLMGQVLASYDENYTKELPESAEVIYTIENKLLQFKKMLDGFLKEDVFLTPLKREKQVMCYLYFVKALYEATDGPFKNPMTEMLLDYSQQGLEAYGQAYLIQVIGHVPFEVMEPRILAGFLDFLMTFISQEGDMRRLAINSLRRLGDHPGFRDHIGPHMDLLHQTFEGETFTAEVFLMEKILGHSARDSRQPGPGTRATMFLENLKSETHKVTKMTNIEILLNRARAQESQERFYTAMHYCNLLKVSAYEAVRHKAGDCLVELFDLLTRSHKNDIVIELLRALEIEGFGFTKYIPQYLGQLIPSLKGEEYSEILEDILFKINNGSYKVQVLLLESLKTMVQCRCRDKDIAGSKPLVGMIFKGLYSNNKRTRQIAFDVLCKGVIGNGALALEERFEIFKWLYGKLNHYVNDFNVFYRTDLLEYAVGMHYIYHFITDYSFMHGGMVFDGGKDVVVYSGTFDPFSLGQKEVCLDLVGLGHEVYVEISEFQWRRRTQASLVRRQIVEMTLADAFHVQTWPQNQPLNMGQESIGEILKARFGQSKVWLAIGEEALLNDDVYGPHCQAIFNLAHVIYRRESVVRSQRQIDIIRKRKQRFTCGFVDRSLRALYETIDVNRIRRNIDQEWDAFYVLDDLASQLIDQKRLYKNEPQYKETIASNDLVLVHHHDLDGRQRLDLLKAFDLSAAINRQAIEDLNYDLFTLVREGSQAPIAYGLYRIEKKGQRVYGLTDYEHGDHQTLCIKALDICMVDDPHSLDQILITELLTMGIANGCTMALVHCKDFKEVLYGVLMRSGFGLLKTKDGILFKADMRSPVIVNLDATARMKETFRRQSDIRQAIAWARSNLQEALVKMYPNHLVLSFDRGMMYNHLIRMITQKNKVNMHENQTQGPFVCVPYGDIFKRWLLPNTITKAFHAERYYPPDLDHFHVDAFPGYLSLVDQGRVLKHYERPLILVDDILDTGNRLLAFEKVLDQVALKIDSVFTGVATQRGRQRFLDQGIHIEGAYEIPEVKAWFNEGDLYPFIGGNGVKRGQTFMNDVLLSVNMILPFVYPNFMKDVKAKDLYEFSSVCLENTKNIFLAIEKVYLERKGKHLTIQNLGEVMIISRWPDRGLGIDQDPHLKPSDFIDNLIEGLRRLKPGFIAH